MGEHTGIEWCHHTFNPWWGCTKVSPGCKHCYAEALAERFSPGNWGPEGSRRFMGDKYWAQPLKWDRKAAAAGERRRVFCGSMCDVFEDREDLEEPRKRLLQLIDETKNLDWLLLTKRPHKVLHLLALSSHGHNTGAQILRHLPNVWIGTSVEDQQRADKRIPELLRIPACVRFLSCEPLLGPVDIELALCTCPWPADAKRSRHLLPCPADVRRPGRTQKWPISWVIVGGESGPNARPMHPEHAYSLRDQCAAAGVPYFFKQHGEWLPAGEQPAGEISLNAPRVSLVDLKDVFAPGHEMIRVGKKAAGRLLAGREWNEVPE